MATLLTRAFFARQTQDVARDLIGKSLVSEIAGQRVTGVIVETEAYLPSGDSACHAAKHRTARTEVMFGAAGFAYVYPIHARYCFNIVTESRERGCAVLIRALQPLEGIDVIQLRRCSDDPRRLTTGPARLCSALGIDRSVDRHDLTRGNLVWLEDAANDHHTEFRIKTSKRIGVTSAKLRRLRYYVTGNPYVSGPLSLRT